MSWSKNTNGTVAEVHSALDAWQAEIAESDRNSTEAIIAAHGKQVARAVDIARTFTIDTPEGHKVFVTAWGHSNGEPDSDSFGMKLDRNKGA